MGEDEVKIRLHGLKKLDMMELGTGPGIEYSESKVPAGAQGELTIITATVALAAISAVAAYFLKKHDNAYFEEEIEIVRPNGQVERRIIRYRAEKSEAPDKQLIEQIRGPSLGG